MIKEKLWKLKIEFESKASVCKYLVPEWYPENPIQWEEISFNFNPNENKNLWIYYWSVIRNKFWKLIMWSSRSIALIWKWNTIQEACDLVNKYILKFSWKLFYRKDIWSNNLIQKKINHMKKIREL